MFASYDKIRQMPKGELHQVYFRGAKLNNGLLVSASHTLRPPALASREDQIQTMFIVRITNSEMRIIVSPAARIVRQGNARVEIKGQYPGDARITAVLYTYWSPAYCEDLRGLE